MEDGLVLEDNPCTVATVNTIKITSIKSVTLKNLTFLQLTPRPKRRNLSDDDFVSAFRLYRLRRSGILYNHPTRFQVLPSQSFMTSRNSQSRVWSVLLHVASPSRIYRPSQKSLHLQHHFFRGIKVFYWET